MYRRLRSVLGKAAVVLIAGAIPLWANLIITPTYDDSITSDPNAAAIEGVIQSAIDVYQNTFSNPINVPITFEECPDGCLGESNFSYEDVSYLRFSTALNNEANQSADQTAAAAANPISSTNPVTGSTDIQMKCANMDALFGADSSPCGTTSFGTIGLGTTLTTPGSGGTSGDYNLMSVVEHEIDEILGLGSTLGVLSNCNRLVSHPCAPAPEDLFRYTSSGTRSFTTDTSAQAFFSITGAADLAQFDNQDDGGDFGDWQSNPLPNGAAIQVQDAFATPFATPSLGVEIRALNVIGYTLAAPEPGTNILMAAALLGLIGLVKRRR